MTPRALPDYLRASLKTFILYCLCHYLFRFFAASTAFSFLCLFSISLAVSSAHARPTVKPGNLIEATDWYLDPDGHKTIDQIKGVGFTPYTRVLSLGYGEGAVWLRLRIKAVHNSSDDLVLRIRPIYLDEIQVYDTLNGDLHPTVLGDRIHPQNDKLETLDLATLIRSSTEPRDIFLRVETTSTRSILVEVLTRPEFDESTLTQTILLSLSLSVILFFFGFGIVHWLVSHDRLMGIFAVKQIASFLFSAAVYGHLRYFWPEGMNAAGLDLTTSVCGILSVTLGLWFELCFAKEVGISEYDRRLVSYFYILLPIEFLLMIIGETRLALLLNMLQVLILPPLVLFIFWKSNCWRDNNGNPPFLPRRVILSYHTTGTLAMVAAATSGLGFMNAYEISLYVATMHGVLSGGLMLLMLIYRNSLRSRREIELALQIGYSKRVLATERSHQEEKDKMMSVLVHELTTPLSVIRMNVEMGIEKAKSRERIDYAINDMVRLIKRFSLAQRWEANQIQIETSDFSIEDALKDAISGSSTPERIVIIEMCGGYVRIDRHILHLAVSNLLENALRYGAQDQPIYLSCARSTQDLGFFEIAIENEPGLAGWPDPQRVFTKFYRAGLAQRISGSGLGLHLSQDLIERAGGRMAYQPTDRRIRFTIMAPGRPRDD